MSSDAIVMRGLALSQFVVFSRSGWDKSNVRIEYSIDARIIAKTESAFPFTPENVPIFDAPEHPQRLLAFLDLVNVGLRHVNVNWLRSLRCNDEKSVFPLGIGDIWRYGRQYILPLDYKKSMVGVQNAGGAVTNICDVKKESSNAFVGKYYLSWWLGWRPDNPSAFSRPISLHLGSHENAQHKREYRISDSSNRAYHRGTWIGVFLVGGLAISVLAWHMLRGILRWGLGGAVLILWGIVVFVFSRIL